MALINCPECKNRISDSSHVCIRCGFKLTPDGIAGIRKNESKALKGCGTGCLSVFMILLIISVIIAIASSSSDESDVATTPIRPLTKVDLVTQVVNSTLGKKTNWKEHPPRVINIDLIEQVAGEDVGGYLVDIQYRADENLTTKMTRISVLLDAQKVIEKLSKSPSLSEVKKYMLRPHLDLVDKYGNASLEQVGKITLRKTVADRINWDLMYSEPFEEVLNTDGQLWLHPVLNHN